MSDYRTKPYTILAIESSCDETAAAVYSTSMGVQSNVLFSQIELHRAYGGVVPEIASRWHIQKIIPIIEQALSDAHMPLDHIDIIAATSKPGLPGSLLVGMATAKAIAYASGKKFIGVNHVEAHIASAHIEHTIPFPYLCLTASGGHSSLYVVKGFGSYERIGHTVDDAAGEAFDKTAKLLELGYPGGPVLERYAQQGNFVDYLAYPRPKKDSLDFSFSGLKTAVLYDLVRHGYYDLEHKKLVLAERDMQTLETVRTQVASSLHVCLGDTLVQKVERAYRLMPELKALTFVGGVAANTYLRSRLEQSAHAHKKIFCAPSRHYCTDNAAMVAFVAHYRAQQGLFDPLSLDIY